MLMQYPRLPALACSALLLVALLLSGTTSLAARATLTQAGAVSPAPVAARPALNNPRAGTCLAGWAGFPYLNRGWVSDQGCAGNRVVGDFTLTLADTSGTKPVPANLVLDTAHCDAKSHPGRC